MPGSTTPMDWSQLVLWMGETFLNADLVPVAVIPWDEDAGMMVDDGEGDSIRIGIYRDLTQEEEWLALLDCPSADHAREALDYLTECQPEGTDWAAWAAQRVQDWDWSGFLEARP